MPRFLLTTGPRRSLIFCLAIRIYASWRSAHGTEVPPALLPDLIQRDGVVRVIGASQPLDIFRDPNELDISEFDDVWNRAAALDDGTRVPDVIDLLFTKQATGRDKDMQDIAFLEAKAEREYLEPNT